MKPNGTESDGLSRKQAEAIPFLISARSLEEGCKAAKLSKSTLYRWLGDETFKAEMDHQREAIISEALDRLKAAIGKAVEVLTGLMDAQENSVKIRACERVIEFFIKAREHSEIEGRLIALEKALAERGA